MIDQTGLDTFEASKAHPGNGGTGAPDWAIHHCGGSDPWWPESGGVVALSRIAQLEED